MKKVFYLLSAFSILFFAACSSDDDNGGNGGNGGSDITSITLSASATDLELGEMVTFTVLSEAGDDVTSMATIDVDGTVLDGNTFSSDEAGTFEATATLNDLTSNTVSVSFGDATDGFVVETENFLLVFWGGAQPGGEGTEIFGFFSMINFEGEDLENSPNYAEVDVLMPLNAEGELQFPGEGGTNPNFFELFDLRVDGMDIDIAEGTDEGTVVVSDFAFPTEAEDPSFIDYQANITFNADDSLDASYQGEWFFINQSEGEGEGAQRPAFEMNSLKVEKVETLEALIAKKKAFINK
ncbi:MAG: hypothetical protein LAT51_05385 [Flavobacteriaceae bacterium]|nr:hypothetical protein [Flavobacteriaceae bacterium]